MGELRANVHSSGHLEEFFEQGWDFESQHATIYPKKKKNHKPVNCFSKSISNKPPVTSFGFRPAGKEKLCPSHVSSIG